MFRTTPIRDLASALRLGERETISLVGGGGKTTALFALGRQVDGTVILSTTTKMGSDRTGGHAPLIDPTTAELTVALDRDRTVLVWKGIDDHRALGFAPEECAVWSDLADVVVLEADGSRRQPFKAPDEHEPVVPATTSTLVACVGAAAFGAPIVGSCHRPEIVARLAGCDVTDPLDPQRLARVLLHPQGSRKDRPADARFVVLLNQVTAMHAPFVEALGTAMADEAPIVAIAPFDPADSPEAER